MAFYRDNFPHATILPKMHILEQHMVEWLHRYHLGAGLMGEQGAESIHQHLHRLEDTNQGIVNPLQRLKYVFNQYNLETDPTLQSCKPPIKRRKREESPTS